MKLYYAKGACSLTPHIVMAELNMVYELESVNLADKTCASGDFRQINPKGSVPALTMDNGEVLTEVAVIAQYLADQKNDGTLFAPFGSMERIRTLEWMNYIATEVHKFFSPLFFAERAFSSMETQNDVKNFYKNNLNTKFNFISEKLGNNDYLMGEKFSIADAYLFNVLTWTKFVGLDLSKWSNITNYMNRISERPAVIRAMTEQGLLK